jgi:hypothetical protein
LSSRGQKSRRCGGVSHFGGFYRGRQRSASSQRSGASGQRGGGKVGKDAAAISVVEVCVDAVDRQLGKLDAVKCLVNNYAVCRAIDSGARVSILNKATVDKLHLRSLGLAKNLI